MRLALGAIALSMLLAGIGLVVLLALPDDLLGSEPLIRLSTEHAPTMLDLIGVAFLVLGGLGLLVTVIVAAQRTAGSRAAVLFTVGYVALLAVSLFAVSADASWYLIPIGATVLWQAGWAIALVLIVRRRATPSRMG